LHAEEGVLADEILDEVDLSFPRQGSVLVLIPASSKELRCREVESRGNGESEVPALGRANLGEESKRLLIFELRDPCTLISTAERIVRELLGEGIPNHAMHGGVGEDVVGRLRGLRDHQVFLDRGASNRLPPATRGRGPADCPAEPDVALDGRVSAAVQNRANRDALNGRHPAPSGRSGGSLLKRAQKRRSAASHRGGSREGP